MGDSDPVRSERRARLRMAAGGDPGPRLEAARHIIEELQIDRSVKPRLYEAVCAVFHSETELMQVLGNKAASAQLIEVHLQKYRNACKTVIILDYEFAYDAYIEEQLRVVHTNLRATYRNRLLNLRHQKDKPVEVRRAHSEYLKFIKGSQIFYRQLVLDLDRIHGGIPELRRAAQTWKDINGSEELPSAPMTSGAKQQHLLLAVQRALLILGDLSRWRASDLDGQKPNRGAAMGYYHLANDIYPPSGIAWNQLALVELESENINYLQVVYYLYRGLSATEVRSGPKVNLTQNLDSIFGKIARMMEKKQLFPLMMRISNGVAGALMSWFLWLQTMCFKGEDRPKFKELEKEVVAQLTNEIKKGAGNIENLLQKIVLINLAGDYYAANKLKESRDEKVMLSFFYYLRFNAVTLQTLLHLLNSDLEFLGDRQDVKKHGAPADQSLTDRVTANMQRMLPALRLYSVWFQSYWRILGADLPGFQITSLEVQDLWHEYARCLSLLSISFPLDRLPADSYLLPEDDETLGFGPFFEQIRHRNWYGDRGLKPKFSDAAISRHLPNVEALMRIRGLLLDGEALCNDRQAPLALSLAPDSVKKGTATKVFAYQEPGQSQDEHTNQLPSEAGHTQPPAPFDGAEASSISTSQQAIPGVTTFDDLGEDESSQFETPSETTSYAVTKDQAMNQMVDNLLEDDETSNVIPYDGDRKVPTTPHHQTFNLASSPLSNQFADSPNLEKFPAFYPGQGDFVLFSSTSPRPLSSAQARVRDDVEIAEMTRRLSSMGRSGSQSSPLSRPLPAFPSLPDESAKIWGVGYPGSTAAPPASAGFSRPAHSSNHSSISYTNGFGTRENIGGLGPSPWPQYPSPASETFYREAAPQASFVNDIGYLSSGFEQANRRPPHSPSHFTGALGSLHSPTGLGSAALGGSELPTPSAGGTPSFSRRTQWPAS